ncbi:YbcC family protein [Pseudoalteromonas sp. T1lg65]|uniref:YbcC family protein n=1 Tax=Pseudoalteromonas sp. T1lg65 TaxID=2077101 RepID=UPI003F7A9DB2
MHAKQHHVESSLTSTQDGQLLQAESNIAPTWPLDQLIAVNPFWGMRHQAFGLVSAKLSALAKVNMLMSSHWYLDLWQLGEISESGLLAALALHKQEESPESFLNELRRSSQLEKSHWHTLAELNDRYRSRHKMLWQDEITHQISQFCAAHYQRVQPVLQQTQQDNNLGLYQHWLQTVSADRGIAIVMGEADLRRYFNALPQNPEQLLAVAINELQINEDILTDYVHLLLLDINGWASWVAYEKWQADLEGKSHNEMRELLTIRMAWELVVWRYTQDKDANLFAQIKHVWNLQQQQLVSLYQDHAKKLEPRLIMQTALELSYQQSLAKALASTTDSASEVPELQAVFCIDVRSEPIRRALEAQHKDIETLGYAGFFGLPIQYQPKDSSYCRPHLPGLLKAPFTVTESDSSTTLSAKRAQKAKWHHWSHSAAASFSMVESFGVSYFYKLLARTFSLSQPVHPVDSNLANGQWQLYDAERPLTTVEKAELVAGILSSLGLKQFAKTVLLVGHGAQTTNNLHEAGLHCGACGGQSGELNAKVLAQLLNDVEVRNALKEKNIEIPKQTQFIAALHNTTTEEIKVFTELDPTSMAWISAASAQVRRERVKAHNPQLANDTDKTLAAHFNAQASDWSQVRPEWGLANNAAFIVAPRSTTKRFTLEGRAFLHNYDAAQDTTFTLLEAILTAPMIVTNWINMQYNASVTEPLKYGSGNKVLHNVVGGHIGVFEGNGGDLRIGLPKQSLHDGEKWMHTPQRLSVFIQAPTQAIEHIIKKHESVSSLVNNQWLYMLAIDAETKLISRYQHGQWVEVS